MWKNSNFDSANYRYRAIPTREEYKKFCEPLSKLQVTATQNWQNIAYTPYVSPPDDSAILYPIKGVTNDLKDLIFATEEAKEQGFSTLAYYDNYKKGWVLGTIDFYYQLPNITTNKIGYILKDMQKRGFNYIFPDKFMILDERTLFGLGGYDGYIFPDMITTTLPFGNGLSGQAMYRYGAKIWTYDVEFLTRNTLPQRVYNYVEHMLAGRTDELYYELLKNEKIRSLFINKKPDEMLTSLFELREIAHKKTEVLMENANTPETIPANGGNELLQQYLSSVFKTSTDSTDWFDDVMKHFENTYDNWLCRLLNTLFIRG